MPDNETLKYLSFSFKPFIVTSSIAPDIRLTSLLQYSTMALYCFVPGPHELEYNPGGKARPKRGTFLKLKVCEKVGKSISLRT